MPMDDAHHGRSPVDQGTLRDRPAATRAARRRLLIVDAPLAAVIGLIEFAVMQHSYVIEEFTLDPRDSSVLWGPYLVLWAASYLSLAFRRIRPLFVFVVTSGCLLAATLLQDIGPDELLPIAFWISFGTLVRRQRLLPSLATLAGALTVTVLQAYLVSESPLRELFGREVYWVNRDPWYSHLELVWLTAGIYLITLSTRLVAALWHRPAAPR